MQSLFSTCWTTLVQYPFSKTRVVQVIDYTSRSSCVVFDNAADFALLLLQLITSCRSGG
jgi:hypothetical protein